MNGKWFVIAVLVSAPGTAALAADPASTLSADQRQIRQQQRIDQGIADGKLNAREAARLQKGQAHVQKVENKVKADGVVTPTERRRLQHAQNVESRRITRLNHNRR